MVTDKIVIENYKSIKKLDLKAKRVNLFIGEPNSGKSNILEALSFFSPGALSDQVDLKKRFRFDRAIDLFYDFEINNNIRVTTSPLSLDISYAQNTNGAIMNSFKLDFSKRIPTKTISIEKTNKNSKENWEIADSYTLEHDGRLTWNHNHRGFSTMFRAYEYKYLQKFNTLSFPYLACPYGDNIPSLLLSNSKLRKMVTTFFLDKGYKMLIEPVTQEVKIAKDVDGTLISYPYSTISETLKRIIFLMLAIESNENTAIIIDEPESNTFPFYTKYIAERFALDKKNQFFLTTHNPYLLANIIQKTPATDLNLCVVKMEDYQTKTYPLNNKQVEKVVEFGVDVFFNLDKFTK